MWWLPLLILSTINLDLSQCDFPVTTKPLSDFRSWVRIQVDPNPTDLLRRQRALFAKAFGETSGGVKNIDLVLKNSESWVSSVDCPASRVLAAHAEHHSIAENATEFSGFLLAKGERLRVDFTSFDTPYGENEEAVLTSVVSAIADGYRVVAHLHNHPFFFDNESGDIAGTLVPSDGDITYYRKLESRGITIEAAWITNGFHIVKIPRARFPEFVNH